MSGSQLSSSAGNLEIAELVRKGCFCPDKVRQDAVDARNFLLSHPAIGDRFDGTLFWLYPAKVCKRGIDDMSKGFIQVHGDDPEAQRFWPEFEKEYEDDPGMLKDHPGMCTVTKSYEEIHGEPWAYDHVEYWWELSFSVYDGDVSRASKEWIDPRKWGSYALERGSSPSYEQCLVDAAAMVRGRLGDFNEYDFETVEEKENHKGKEIMLFVPCKEVYHNPITGRDERCSEMKDNPDYLYNHSGMLNRRWLLWFRGTDYCRNAWKDEFDKLPEAEGGPVQLKT